MTGNAESDAPKEYNENDLYNIWERLERLSRSYGVETVKEACRRYAKESQ